jgi:hypothetical protein
LPWSGKPTIIVNAPIAIRPGQSQVMASGAISAARVMTATRPGGWASWIFAAAGAGSRGQPRAQGLVTPWPPAGQPPNPNS